MSPPTSFRSLLASSNCASISLLIGIRLVQSSGNRFYGLSSSTFSSLSASATPENLLFSSRKQCPSIKVQAVGGETEQPKWWEKKAGPNMIDINSTEQFLNALKDAGEGDRLVIVDFYGTWCGSCRAMFPKLCKTADEHPEILFLKVNFDENKSLCKSLNVKMLPYFHFYRGADGQVESFSCSLIKLQKLRDAIERHKVGRSSLTTEKVEDSSL